MDTNTVAEQVEAQSVSEEKEKSSLYLPKSLYKELRHRAIDEGVSATTLIERGIRMLLAQDGAQTTQEATGVKG